LPALFFCIFFIPCIVYKKTHNIFT
jgi:hypothetical protein